jgi:very-short-patch-repair endonuclease/intein/homing endonuclease
MAKMILPDNSPKNKKRMVAASGGYQAGNIEKKGHNSFAHSTAVNIPITKNAQYAGAGANVAMTQPMFFSPLHTPQNWQIASRRREIMQWARFYYCFTPENLVLMADGTEKKIEDIRIGDKVVNGEGGISLVKEVHSRNIEEKILEMKVGGNNRSIKVTKQHEFPVIKQEVWEQHPNTVFSKKRKKTLLNKNGDFKFEEVWTESQDIEIGDRLYTPLIAIDDNDIELSVDECAFLQNKLFRAVTSIEEIFYKGKVYDLELEDVHSYCVNRCVVHNCNEPKVAAGVDFYSNFSMNGFKLECKSRKILKFYERLAEKLELPEKCNAISHEYFLLGDVFPFAEIDCSYCHGSGRTPDGRLCNHPDGSFKHIKLMNPDYIDVKDNPVINNPDFYLIPDEELKMLIQRKEPRSAYEALPSNFVKLVSTGQPIPLSKDSISHLKHNAADYATYGTSMLQRLFTVLAYKTKMMTANWIIAERLILPIRVVKIGDENRPATDADLQDVQNQLSAVANDPNLTIVTHHAFDYEWYGACHDDQTEILTPTGWKKFKDIEKNSTVGTYNVYTKEMEWGNVNEFYEYHFESTESLKMFHFQSKGVDIKVTPNHKMLIERNGVVQSAYSQDVEHNDKFISTVNWSGDIPQQLPYMESPLSHLGLDEYLKFVGYYISEGGVKEERGKNLSLDKEVQACSFSQNKNSSYYSDIKNSVKLAYPNFSEYEDVRNKNISCFMTINSVDISRYLSEEFGHHSWNKKIPQWIKNLPQNKLKIIYNAMMNGDGSTRNDGILPRYRYTTTSEQLAGDWSEICLKLGYWPYVSQEKASNDNSRDIYRISYSESRRSKLFNIRQQNIKQEEYTGSVYCVSVDNAWIVTRRNGRITVQGNSGKIHNITQELEEVGKEILDGLMLNQAILNGEMSGYCVSEDTLTLTDYGFKHYWEIDETKDKIACYNDQTKKLEYHLPYEKVVFDYKGEMVHFNTDKIDILVTPNHRMWSAKRGSDKFEIIRAEDVRPRAKFVGAVEGYEGEYQKSVQIGEEEYSIYDYCKMVGYYVSEGWLRWHKYSGEKTYTSIRIGQNRDGKAREDIENLFYSAFDEDRVRNKDAYMDILNKDLASYFNNNFGSGAKNKKLSPFIKNLSTDCLEIVIDAMINGDGCVNNRKDKYRKNKSEVYYTSSKQLAQDFAEIAFKCGYVVKIREYNKKESKNKVYFNKTGHQYKTNLQQYVVYISKGFKGRTPILHSKSVKYAGKEITRESYNGKIYCFSVPHEKFVTMRNGIVTIQGNTSAQVGIEVLIRRLDNWRNKLKNWVETKIFKPVAMMQGFIDEEESSILGEIVYLYPKLVWNDLQLRDKTSRIQTFVQLHDKGLISAQTLLEELDLDYDSEVEKIREEQTIAQANGMIAGGAGGAMGGMGGMPPIGGDMGGGMGALPPDIAGEGLGGMPGAGAGGMPGAEMGGMPGAEMGGAPMGAAASSSLPKVGKRGSKSKEEEEKPLPPRNIKLTKLESKVLKVLTAMNEPFSLFAQYEVRVPGESRPYSIDFAYPQIGVGIEVDGAIWHERPDFKQRDLNRDQNLGNIGWRILRFNEEAISENMDAVSNVISQHVKEAASQKKKAESDGLIKIASEEDSFENVQYSYCLKQGKIGTKRNNIPYGKILYIGNVKNE